MKSLFNFDIEANTYDEYYKTEFGSRIDSQQKECVRTFLEKIPNGNILELGSGTGHWSEWISKLGFKVHGIDISEKMLEKSKSKNIPNCRFDKMSMSDLQFDDNSIDNIIAVTSLEFSIDLDKTFSEIKRVLKKGGSFIAAVLNEESIIGRTKKDNPIFRNANFFTEKELITRLSSFGTPSICKTAFINDNFEIDGRGKATMIVGFVSVNK